MRAGPVAVLERALRVARLQPDASFTPPPVAVSDGLWTIDRRARLLGLPDPCTCTLVRVDSGDLVLIGAPSFFSSCREDVCRLGRVSGGRAQQLPPLLRRRGRRRARGADFRRRAGASRAGPDAAAGRRARHGKRGAVDVGARVRRVRAQPRRRRGRLLPRRQPHAHLHRLGSNIVEFARPSHRWLTRVYGIRAEFGPSRNARLLLRSDPGGATRLLRRALEWPFERIIVAHGARVERDAGAVFRAAFAPYL
jgi:hypothetical protein